MSNVLITGGTGLIGSAISKALVEKGYEVTILTHNPIKKESSASIQYASWNINEEFIDEDALRKADHIIHLAGEGIADRRWTEKRKKAIRDSRVKGSRLLAKTLKKTPNKVRSLTSASAIGWYGPDPVIPNPHPFRETDPHFPGFLGDTCFEWEQAIQTIPDSIRLVILRQGIVLDKRGGALAKFLGPLRWGIAAIPGNGKQVISWIHVDDLVNMYINSIEKENISGIYNAVAPKPVNNSELMRTLARSRGKFFIPVKVPAFMLKIVLGELSIEVLKSATVDCAKWQKEGGNFVFGELKQAIADLV